MMNGYSTYISPSIKIVSFRYRRDLLKTSIPIPVIDPDTDIEPWVEGGETDGEL